MPSIDTKPRKGHREAGFGPLVRLERTHQSLSHHGPPGFPGGVGKTWEPGAFEELLDDVSSKLFGVYCDDTVVYPGHGDDTTLGAERPHLDEWRERGW